MLSRNRFYLLGAWLWLAFGAVELLAADEPFWTKPPEQWSPEEIRQLMTDSPWAKVAKAKYAPAVSGTGIPGEAVPGPAEALLGRFPARVVHRRWAALLVAAPLAR